MKIHNGQTPVVSITLPSELLNKFEEFIKSRGYYSRSEAFRDAIRNLMAEAEIAKGDTEKVATMIMLTRDFARKDIEGRISEIKHQFDDVIVESIHRHVGRKYCIDVLIAEGSKDRIIAAIGRIRGIRGVYQVKTMFLPIE
ncbi:MAG: CopG family ribbon-helix-helix protein [Candidatus Asgardarchaeia archaeon]